MSLSKRTIDFKSNKRQSRQPGSTSIAHKLLKAGAGFMSLRAAQADHDPMDPEHQECHAKPVKVLDANTGKEVDAAIVVCEKHLKVKGKISDGERKAINDVFACAKPADNDVGYNPNCAVAGFNLLCSYPHYAVMLIASNAMCVGNKLISNFTPAPETIQCLTEKSYQVANVAMEELNNAANSSGGFFYKLGIATTIVAVTGTLVGGYKLAEWWKKRQGYTQLAQDEPLRQDDAEMATHGSGSAYSKPK